MDKGSNSKVYITQLILIRKFDLNLSEKSFRILHANVLTDFILFLLFNNTRVSSFSTQLQIFYDT